MLNELLKWYTLKLNKYSQLNPFTQVYGLARSSIAFSLLISLLFSKNEVLFIDHSNIDIDTFFFNVTDISFFKLLNHNLVLAKYISIIILIAVIVGFVPQITGILHWYICFSFIVSSPVIEGGDQLNSIITFLLIPVTILDNRANHWYKPKNKKRSYINLFAWSCFLLITLQVSIVYFHAAIAKFSVEEWLNGTSVYYWSTHNIYGVNLYLKPFIFYLMSNKYIVVSLTWGTLLLEIVLFAWIFMRRNKWNWKFLFIASVGFHLGIIFFHSLVSFYFSMVGALILYLVPKGYNLRNLLFLKK